MKGVSREIIITLIFLIVIMLFLILVFTIFKEQLKPFTDMLKNILKNAVKVS